ncbi:MAG: type VI secretion system baseplate subunit TssE [Oscillospiraceae bacterium]|nr:type VI secretion system baseplate subunit TssE [Oscillospiraceae bacterium]
MSNSASHGGYGGDMFVPALVDRLSENSGGPMTRNAFRKTVLRDLSWLLNCTNLEKQLPLENYPRIKNSVLNYGISALTGVHLSESDLDIVAERLQRAIAYFEPRILEKTLKVSVTHEVENDLYNYAHFRIEATYWFEPYPIDMVIRAQWDMDTGGVEIQEDK